MLENYLELVKDQNRTICTLRHMMERGYSIIFLADRNQFNMAMSSGSWALVKHKTPKDRNEGIVLFKTYDEAYDKARHLVWIDNDLTKNCDTIEPLQDLKNLIKRVKIKE